MNNRGNEEIKQIFEKLGNERFSTEILKNKIDNLIEENYGFNKIKIAIYEYVKHNNLNQNDVKNIKKKEIGGENGFIENNYYVKIAEKNNIRNINNTFYETDITNQTLVKYIKTINTLFPNLLPKTEVQIFNDFTFIKTEKAFEKCQEVSFKNIEEECKKLNSNPEQQKTFKQNIGKGIVKSLLFGRLFGCKDIREDNIVFNTETGEIKIVDYMSPAINYSGNLNVEKTIAMNFTNFNYLNNEDFITSIKEEQEKLEKKFPNKREIPFALKFLYIANQNIIDNHINILNSANFYSFMINILIGSQATGYRNRLFDFCIPNARLINSLKKEDYLDDRTILEVIFEMKTEINETFIKIEEPKEKNPKEYEQQKQLLEFASENFKELAEYINNRYKIDIYNNPDYNILTNENLKKSKNKYFNKKYVKNKFDGTENIKNNIEILKYTQKGIINPQQKLNLLCELYINIMDNLNVKSKGYLYIKMNYIDELSKSLQNIVENLNKIKIYEEKIKSLKIIKKIYWCVNEQRKKLNQNIFMFTKNITQCIILQENTEESLAAINKAIKEIQMKELDVEEKKNMGY